MAIDSDNPFLPHEIITNVLKRLPVESLIRFLCVCKPWKNLIKTPSFVADHLQHSSNQSPFLIWHWNDDTKRQRLEMMDYKLRVLHGLPSTLFSSRACRIVGSSNGVLCVQIYTEIPFLPSLFLCNPATREVSEVPQPINNINGEFRVGFGFSPIVNDYKIVISGATLFNNRVEVYSLRTRSWKEIKVGNFGVVEFFSCPSVTANGAIFWSGCFSLEGENNLVIGGEEENYDWIIISFDIAMEEFSLISLPDLLDLSFWDKLTVYEDKLAILSLDVVGNYESSRIDLWVMEENIDEIVCKVDNIPEDETALYLLNLNTLDLEKFATCRRGYSHSITVNYVESLVPVANIHNEEADSKS
ncbi:hypothetical protein K1719_044026 [Acacia pycnantha]|nr:hypothetical protein K1719_044026 [Acacia pycnantha]